MPIANQIRVALSLLALLSFLAPTSALAWGYQGHRVVGSIADELLKGSNTATQVQTILNDGDPNGKLTLRLVGPWADCVKSVQHNDDGSFKYVVQDKDERIQYEVPCTVFSTVSAENARMVDYVQRNWSNCSVAPDTPPGNCHSTYHFDDVTIQRDSFNRNEQGTNDHDVVAAIAAAIAVLRGNLAPPPFSIKDKKEALMLLVHFVGDLHQPLHVGSIYLGPDSKPVDPDIAHTIDPLTQTRGGNSIHDQNIDLHSEWDNIPYDLGDKFTQELMTAARAVPASAGTTTDDWTASWAGDSIQLARHVLSIINYQQPDPQKPNWNLTFDDRTSYLLMADLLKRRQLAEGGAHLAEILKAIWPPN